MTNNSNLREAAALHLNQAYVNVGEPGQSNLKNIDTALQGNNDLGYALRRNTHTDSAGGEAQDNDSDVYKCLAPPGAKNYAIFYNDQDAP